MSVVESSLQHIIPFDDRASKDDLRQLAAKHVDPTNAVVVIVGPRAKIAPQLEKIGITAASLTTSGPEGD